MCSPTSIYTFPSVGDCDRRPVSAGKTTLLSLISGLTTPTGGEVLFEGHNLAKMDRYCYRSRDIGVIFQSFNLLPGLTVLENIMLTMDASGKRFDRPKRDIALDLLKQVHLPERYANERILHLSGGEQQRVAIARALSTNPQVVIADEPTGNLDPATQDDIMRIFIELAHEQNKMRDHRDAFTPDCRTIRPRIPIEQRD